MTAEGSFTPIASSAVRRDRVPAALFRIGERHATAPSMRHRHENATVVYPFEAVRIVELLSAGSVTYQQGEPVVDGDDFVAALTLLPLVRSELDQTELSLIDMARGRGMTWSEVAHGLGLASAQAAQQRYTRLSSRQDDEG
jgi:hypothetical protein